MEQLKKENSNFGVIYNGYINIPADGSYNFTLASYKDTQLFIDGDEIHENEGIMPLAKGFHKIKVKYIYNMPVQTQGGRARQTPLRVFITDPLTQAKKEIDGSSLYN
jgi:hexosaminidase